MTQSTFTLAQVISIAQKVAPNATIAELMNAINAETACNNAPQSETAKVDEPQTPKEESREIVKPAYNENKPKKPTKKQLADAYAKIQAYKEHNGVENYRIEDDSIDNCHTGEYWLFRSSDISDRKWGAISLSLRKAIETLGGNSLYDGKGGFAIPTKAYRSAYRAYKKAAK